MSIQSVAEKKVVISEIWVKCRKSESECYVMGKNYGLKRVAILANGHPIHLDKDYMLEKKFISKEEYDNLLLNS